MGNPTNKLNDQFVIPNGSVADTLEKPTLVEPTTAEVNIAVNELDRQFDPIQSLSEAALAYAVSNAPRDAETPIFKQADIEYLSRKRQVIEHIFNNGQRIAALRDAKVLERQDVLSFGRAMLAKAKSGTRKGMAILNRYPNTLVDQEALIAGSVLGAPEGEFRRLSFQDGEWLWECFRNNDKEPYEVTRYIKNSLRDTVTSVKYMEGVERSRVRTLTDTQLNNFAYWSTQATNAVIAAYEKGDIKA